MHTDRGRNGRGSLVALLLGSALAGMGHAQAVGGEDIHLVPRPPVEQLRGSSLLPAVRAIDREYGSLELTGSLARVGEAMKSGSPISAADQTILDRHAILWQRATAARLEGPADESLDTMFDEVVLAEGGPGVDPLHLREVARMLRGLSTDVFEYELTRSLLATGTQGYARGYGRRTAPPAAGATGLDSTDLQSLRDEYLPSLQARIGTAAGRLHTILSET